MKVTRIAQVMGHLQPVALKQWSRREAMRKAVGATKHRCACLLQHNLSSTLLIELVQAARNQYPVSMGSSIRSSTLIRRPPGSNSVNTC